MALPGDLLQLLQSLTSNSEQDVMNEIRNAEQSTLARQAGRGMALSNGTLFKVKDAIMEVIERRQSLLMKALEDAMQARPLRQIEESTPIELSNVVMDDLGRYYAHGEQAIRKVQRTIRYLDGLAPSISEEGEKKRARLIAEIEVLIARTSARSATPRRAPPAGGRVFVVHGRNEDVRREVCQEIRNCGLEPVVLHEQPNCGRTIIEKFEDYSDVCFAVVLLTPDDHGALARSNYLRPRARQNVILELGFFIGRLGRDRVCPLYEGDVELPSDYDGVLYVLLDQAGVWRAQFRRELEAAGVLPGQ